MHQELKHIHLVLFDLDGTLAETALDLGATLNQMLEEQQLPTLSMEHIRPAAARGALGLLRRGFADSPMMNGHSQQQIDQAIEALRPRFLTIYERRLCEQARLFAGAKPSLDFFKQIGMAWGIVTNKPGYLAEPLLAYLGILKSAHCLVYGDTTEHRKPHPQPLLYASEQLQIAAEQCLYVGDSLYDVQAAAAAGMRSAIVSYSCESRATLAKESNWLDLADLSELQQWFDGYQSPSKSSSQSSSQSSSKQSPLRT